MNIFQEIKLAFEVKGFITDAVKGATQMNNTQAGWRSSEFWLHLASQAALLWGSVQGFVPAKYAAIISAAGVAVYTIARTVLKTVTDIKAAQASDPVPASSPTVVVQNNPQ